jgi:hypothetical protein
VSVKRKNYLIVKDTKDKATPLSCKLCKILMKDADDVSSFMRSAVCRECEEKWFNPNRSAWEKGWRPDRQEIKEYLIKRRKTRYIKI